MSDDKTDGKELESIIDQLAEGINKSETPLREQFKEHLPSLDLKVGVIQKEQEVYELIEVIAYPSIDVEVSKAVRYTIRSNGYRRNGKPFFHDYMKIYGSDGKTAKIEKKYGDLVNFIERLLIALMVVFKPSVIVKETGSGLRADDPQVLEANAALSEYNLMLGAMSIYKKPGLLNKPKKVSQQIEYFEVHGSDLLEKIENYKP